MNTRQSILFPIVLITLLGAPSPFSPALIACSDTTSAKRVTGRWMGTLKVQAFELRIVFRVSSDQSGVLFSENKVRFALPRIAGIYEGFLQAGDTSISGEWRQGGQAFPLVLRRMLQEIEPPRRPQEPKPPYPYETEDVTYPNGAAGITLAGTLTYPRSGGPFPAVVLITGSGPQDRDETIFNHRPFKVLADYLSRQTIAVLRVDDRGVGKSTGSFATATSEDFAADALAGVDYLKTHPRIDTKNIGLIGHSEGGLIAPMVANRSGDVAFIVLMAGPALTGEQIVLLQSELISRASGVPEDSIRMQLELTRRLFAVIKEENDTARASARMREIVAEVAAKAGSEEQRNIIRRSVEQSTRSLNTPWFRYFLTYDPLPALKAVKCPVLAVNGEKDLQVPPRQNLEGIESALRLGGNRDHLVKMLPGLNHLFQTAQTGSPMEYGKIEETISPDALKVIGDWIAGQTSAKE